MELVIKSNYQLHGFPKLVSGGEIWSSCHLHWLNRDAIYHWANRWLRPKTTITHKIFFSTQRHNAHNVSNACRPKVVCCIPANRKSQYAIISLGKATRKELDYRLYCDRLVVFPGLSRHGCPAWPNSSSPSPFLKHQPRVVHDLALKAYPVWAHTQDRQLMPKLPVSDILRDQ